MHPAVLLAIAIFGEVAEREALTLESAVEVAMVQARDVIHARADVLLVDVVKARALSRILPRLDLTIQAREDFEGTPYAELRGPVFCDSVDMNFPCESGRMDFRDGAFIDRQQVNDISQPNFNLRITGSQLIYDGGRWWVELERVGDIRAQRSANQRSVENRVRLSVVSTFYGLERAHQAVKAFELQLARTEESLARAKARFLEDPSKKSDVAAAERNAAQDRVTLARRRFTESRAKRNLNLVMGRPADVPVSLSIPSAITTVTRPLPKIALPPLEKLKRIADRERPLLKLHRAALRVLQKNIQIRESAYYPTLTFGLSYLKTSRRPDRVFGDPTENYLANLSLTLRWNLFIGLAHKASVEEGKLALSKAVASYQDAKRRVMGDVQDRLENLHLQTQVYDLNREAVRRALEALEAARAQVEAGRTTVFELRNAEINYTQARLAAINARLDVELAKEQLRQVLGGLLPIGDS